MLLQRDLAHNESVHAQIHAELDAIEANRAQLQKELDLHSEKVNRVNRQISRLDKEVTSKCGTDAEFLRSDVKLKSLREVSRQTLRTIGEIKESQLKVKKRIINFGSSEINIEVQTFTLKAA